MRLKTQSIYRVLIIAGGLMLAGCGTTYELPSPGEDQTARAAQLFAEGQAEGARRPLTASVAERRFKRVKSRVLPKGKAVCEAATKDRSNFNCDVSVEIDHKMQSRNAYFTFEDGEPVIRLSMPLLQDSSNDDEIAFVMGHEYGHLIGRHIEKQQQQALAGALILGTLAAAAGSAGGGYYDHQLVNDSMAIGAAAGSAAYSQTYELESDTLGTRIVHLAGYDPTAGAKYFARPEGERLATGKLSFWGTHPPDQKRVATVLATVDQINAKVGLKKKQY